MLQDKLSFGLISNILLSNTELFGVAYSSDYYRSEAQGGQTGKSKTESCIRVLGVDTGALDLTESHIHVIFHATINGLPSLKCRCLRKNALKVDGGYNEENQGEDSNKEGWNSNAGY